MKIMRRILPLFLAILLVLASLGTFAAFAFTDGQDVGIGTVTEQTSRTVAEGLTYETAAIQSDSGANQYVHTLTFNPKTSDYMPIVYSKFSGYGATTLASAQKAETIGYDVKAGINASFFSFTGKSANTYGGVNICDGKILQGNNSHGVTWMLTFNSDGTSALVQSRVTYSLSANDDAWKATLSYINICPENTYTGIYYYDTFCGTATDTKAAGVEVVFEKKDGTELTVGGTLVGEVVEIRDNVSSGGPIGTTQFVLYASDKSQYAASLRALAVGDKVAITANETVAKSKEAMENCNSALVTYGYHIVADGVNVTANDGLGEDFNTARAQRSAIGVKADGTLVIVASPGRTADYAGMTVYELADYLIAQGCVTAVNLDGGGSTQMTVENESGELEAVLAYGRSVANSILIVARPTIESETSEKLQELISDASKLVDSSSYIGDVESLRTALEYAKAVSASKQSMPGDYTKAIMRLSTALDVKGLLGDLNGNGKIDSTDYIQLKRAVLGTYTMTDEQKAAADINKDGNVNSTDYILLKRAVLGTYTIPG